MTICIAGKNNIAVNALEYLLKKYPEYHFLVCTNKTDNGINTWQKSLKYYANKWGIPICELKDLYEKEDLLFVSLEYDRIIRVEKFKTSKLYNIHFSKLPSYKGMYTSVMPLLNGENESGVTLHKIDKGIDTGEIIDQTNFQINININARNLYDLYLTNGFELFKNNIDSLIRGDFQSLPQNAYRSSYYSKATIDFSMLNINTNKTAFEIHNQIRAYSFRDYQLPELCGYKIYKSEITSDKSTLKSGSIVNQHNNYFIMSTIDYDIKVFIDLCGQLFDAAQKGDIEAIEKIEKNEYPLDVRSKEGWDIFIVACYYNQFKLIQYLLEKGWNVNTRNNKGTTALMYAMTAASEGRGSQSLKILIDKADSTLKDDMEKSIYEYAESYGKKEILNILNESKQV